MMRSRAGAYAALTGGIMLAAIASELTWRSTTSGLQVTTGQTGSQVTGSLTLVLAAAVGAGALLSLTLRALGRRVIGAALVLIGVAMVVVGVRHSAAWPAWLYAAAGLLVAAGALTMTLSAGGWASGLRRYERAGERPLTTPDDDPTAVWKALDAGIDPTESAPSAGARDSDRSE